MAEPLLGVTQSAMGYSWWLREADDRAALAMAQRLGVPEILTRVMSGRGVHLEEAETFLSPTLKSLLPDPFHLLDMEKAEADPTFDVDGVDAAHKLAIITSLAYGTAINFGAVHVEGIRSVTANDMIYAREMGYVIKLLGIAAKTERGIEQRVHPCFVPKDAPIAKVDGVYNAVVAYGDAVGDVVFEGQGAGGGPTASSVVSDLMDVARGGGVMPFNIPTDQLQAATLASMDDLRSSYYIRLTVLDQPGVLADVTGIFRDHAISMRSFVQHDRQPNESVEIALTTHEAQESAMQDALAKVAALKAVVAEPQRIRIETGV